MSDLTALPAPPRNALKLFLNAPRYLLSLMGLTDDSAFAELAERHGEVFTFYTVSLGGIKRPVVVVTSPLGVRQLYSAKFSEVNSVDGQRIFATPYGRESLFLKDGPPHHRLRRILTPPFTGEALQKSRQIMTEVLGRSFDQLPTGKPFKLIDVLAQSTAEIIVRLCMGIEDEKLLAIWVPAMQNFAHLLTTNKALLALMLKPVYDVKWPEFWAAKEKADRLIFDEIKRRREAGNLEGAHDILAVLLRSTTETGELLTDVEVRDQLVTLLVAGHETTATTGAWVMERVVRHPDVLQRLTDEAIEGKTDTYAKAVAQETLRLRPPLLAVMRRTLIPIELGGYAIPADTWVMTPFRAIHRNPELYPDPDRFFPDRFLQTQPPPFGWVPFGGGPHKCLGMHFAMLELIVAMHELVKRFELKPENPRDEKVRVRVATMAPGQGASLVINRRRDLSPVSA